MKIILKGHSYKYAVEQMLSTVFPGTRPEYCERAENGESLEVGLSRGNSYTTALCLFRREGERYVGRAAVRTDRMTDSTETDRLCQFLIKNAIYRAVRKSGLQRPPWGALTGVRPGKLMAGLLREADEKQAAEVNAAADKGCREDTGAAGGVPTNVADREAVERFIKEYDVTPERARLCCETSRKTLEAEASLTEKDICLYVGIPFCPTRCAYCSFVSQSVEKSMKLIPPFLEALKQEIRIVGAAVEAAGLHPVSVYFGGGTPTTLSADQTDELCSALYAAFDLSGLREFTVEAGRPDTITEEKLAVLRRYGVDRLSVNPQTMRDSVLETIGRRHTAADVERALALVRAAGGFSVNMDLIAGLPSDTVDGFAYTMERVLELAPENITVHTLSLKRGSALTMQGSEIPHAAEVEQMLKLAYERLRKNEYAPYYLYRQKNMSGGFENTGWTRPGHDNLYNICMMEELCGILAMGGGGSTKLIRPGGGKNLRLTAPKYPLEYIEQIEKTCGDKERIGIFYANI